MIQILQQSRGSWRLLEHRPRTALLQNLHFPLLGSSSSQSGYHLKTRETAYIVYIITNLI